MTLTNRSRTVLPALAATAALALACAPSLEDEFPFDGALPPGERITHEDLGNGVTKTRVDASAKEAWVYYDMDSTRELSVDEAFDTNAWDLAFQRFKIITNSGVNGTSEMGTAVLEGADFDQLSAPPESGYLQDQTDGPDGNSDVDSPFLVGDGWYAYSLTQHKLAPRDVVYVVRTAEARFVAMQMLGYYDDAGNAGHLSFRWKMLADSE